jgi:hypothetical protein
VGQSRLPRPAKPSGQRYSTCCYLPLSLLLIIDQQLKSIYTAIEDFRTNVSGAHWDAVTGATIEGPMAEKVWNDIVTAKVRYITCFLLISFDTLPP